MEMVTYLELTSNKVISKILSFICMKGSYLWDGMEAYETSHH